jgi:hypothetical protein
LSAACLGLCSGGSGWRETDSQASLPRCCASPDRWTHHPLPPTPPPPHTNTAQGLDPLKIIENEDEEAFLSYRNKELNNGRLAMIAAAGITVQEKFITGGAWSGVSKSSQSAER